MSAADAGSAAQRVMACPPGHRISISIECTPSPSDRFGTPHLVTLGHDWTAETVHDLEAERVGRALGGWCSCLFFVEEVVPAYRGILETIGFPVTEFCSRPWWRRTATAGPVRCTQCPSGRACGSGTSSQTAEQQARTEMSPQGFARRIDTTAAEGLPQVAVDQATSLLRAAGTAWAAWADPEVVDGGQDEVYSLWRAGLTPIYLETLARALPRDALPLPAEFFLAVRFGRIDEGWLSTVVAAFPTRDFAIWAGEQEYDWDRIPPETVWRMAGLGLSDADAIAALDADVEVDALIELSEGAAISAASAARWLTVWTSLGVVPTSVHYRLLARHRAVLNLPPRWRLDEAVAVTARYGGTPPSRTELAGMLALTSDLGLIEAAVRRGVRSATDLRFIQMIRTGRPS